MTLDPAHDYLSLDGLEPFTLRQGSNDPLTVANCLRGALNYQDLRLLAGSIGTQPGDMVLELWGPELPTGVTPGVGDGIADAAEIGYTIQTIEYRPLTQAYRCVCRLQVVA
jgi:hypothetical protein